MQNGGTRNAVQLVRLEYFNAKEMVERKDFAKDFDVHII